TLARGGVGPPPAPPPAPALAVRPPGGAPPPPPGGAAPGTEPRPPPGPEPGVRGHRRGGADTRSRCAAAAAPAPARARGAARRHALRGIVPGVLRVRGVRAAPPHRLRDRARPGGAAAGGGLRTLGDEARLALLPELDPAQGQPAELTLGNVRAQRPARRAAQRAARRGAGARRARGTRDEPARRLALDARTSVRGTLPGRRRAAPPV